MWRRDRLLFVSQDCCGFALAEIKSLMEAGFFPYPVRG